MGLSEGNMWVYRYGEISHIPTESLDIKIEQQKEVLEKAKAKYEAEKRGSGCVWRNSGMRCERKNLWRL